LRSPYSREAWLLIIGSALSAGVFMGSVQLLSPLYARRLGAGPSEIGGLSAAAALAYLLGSLAAGGLAGRLGVRRLMLLGIAVCGLGMGLGPVAVAMPRGAQYPMLLAAQVVSNIGAALKSVGLVAALAGVTAASLRTGAYAVHEAASGAAMLSGALVGGAMPALLAGALRANSEAPLPYALAIGINAALSLLALWPVMRVAERSAAATGGSARGRLSWDGALLLLILCGVGTTGAQAAAKAFGAVYLDQTWHVPTALIGSMVSVGLGASVAGALASGRLSRRMRNGQLMMLGSAGVGTGLLLLGMVPGVPAAATGLVLVYGVLGLWRPAYQAAQMEVAPPEGRAAVSGLSAMGMSAGFGAMSYGGGALAAGAGYPPVFVLGAAAAILAGILSLLLAARLGQRVQGSEDRGGPAAAARVATPGEVLTPRGAGAPEKDR
jgi:MFS family permease